MRERNNFWIRRLNSSRLSRRRFVGGAGALGTGAAAFGLVGCGNDDDDAAAAPTPTPADVDDDSDPDDDPTPTPDAEARTRGGMIRTLSADNTWDTFDADRTRFGPMGTILNMTNQGVVQWGNYANAELAGYFAESWEQPDDRTFVFTVRDGLTWHDKPPVNGRLANANDIVYHVERNRAGTLMDGTEDPNFYRRSQFQNVETVEAVDERTVRIVTEQPYPFLLNLFAGTWTRIQAPEAVEEFEGRYTQFSDDLIIGTGEFVLTDFTAEGDLRYERFDNSTRQPWVDGMIQVPLFADPAGQQAAFEQQLIDAFSPQTQAVLNDLKERYEGEIYERSTFVANPVSGTYYGGAPPWNDERLIGAIYRTMDRRGLLEQFLDGRGAMAGFAPPAWAPYALPEGELVQFPGYWSDREADHAEARAMWDAADGAGLGDITVDIPDIYEGAHGDVGAIVTNHLESVLGNNFRVSLEPYATITSKIVAQEYGNGNPNVWFGWVNPPADPDMSLSYIATFKDTSDSYRQFEVEMPRLQELIRDLEVEFDGERRVELCREAETEVLNHWGGGLTPLYLQIANILYHNYYHAGEVTNFVTTHNVWRDNWLDQNDPTWQTRPA